MTNNKQKELKIERFFGKKSVVATLLIIEDLILFFVVSYLVNVILNFVEFSKRFFKKPAKYIGIDNCIPDFDRIAKHKEIYIFILIAFIVLLLFLNIRQAYKMRTSFASKGFNLNQKGSARWATTTEIKEQYTKIAEKTETFDGYGGTIVSRIGKHLYIDQAITNNLIIGITRSGKGEMFVIPSIDVYSRAKEKTSLVVLDPKTELYKTSKKTLEERGYEVRLLSLVDPIHSMGFNPLSQIVEMYVAGEYDNAELLTQTFCYSIFNPDKPLNGDTFWQDSPTALLASLILAQVDDCVKQNKLDNEERRKIWDAKRQKYDFLSAEERKDVAAYIENFKKEKPDKDLIMDTSISALPEDEKFVEIDLHLKKINMYSIINLFGELVSEVNPQNPDRTALDEYFSRRPALDRAKIKFFGVQVAGARTKASIYASMLMKVTIFTYESFAKMTAESTLNLEDIGFGDKPMAVFIEMPDYDKSSHFLGTVFLRQMYFVLAKRATREVSGKCKNRVKVIADEFGNMPAIEAMENIMTVCLGRNISFDLYIQAYSQLTKLYGENAKTITGNCGNTIYILSDDDETTSKFAKNIGNETIVDLQRSGNRFSVKKTTTESVSEKPLINMNQLEELKQGECVIKRVMKRTDLKGRPITPHPIFNNHENGRQLLFRYQYLKDDFPNPTEIDLSKINTEDRSHINLKERVWDYRLSFAQFALSNTNVYDNIKVKVGELENKDSIISTFDQVLGLTIDEDMLVDEVVAQLHELDIEEKTRIKFINMLS